MKAKQVTIQEIIVDIREILNKISFALKDHEQRLQAVEELDLKSELELLRCRITLISDPKKQTEALQAFNGLCDLLGVADLETPK